MPATPRLIIQTLANGANINHTTAGDGDTALIQASRLGHADTVQALLDRDADIFIENIRGGSAIPVALRYHRQAVLNTFSIMPQEQGFQELSIGF